MTDDQSCCVCWASEIPFTPCGTYSDGGVKLVCGLCAPIVEPAAGGGPPPCARCVRLAGRIDATNGQLARVAPVGLQAPVALSAVAARLVDEAVSLRGHVEGEHPATASAPPAESFG